MSFAEVLYSSLEILTCAGAHRVLTAMVPGLGVMDLGSASLLCSAGTWNDETRGRESKNMLAVSFLNSSLWFVLGEMTTIEVSGSGVANAPYPILLRCFLQIDLNCVSEIASLCENFSMTLSCIVTTVPENPSPDNATASPTNWESVGHMFMVLLN